MSITDVETVCTEMQLAGEVLGTKNLNNLLPEGWSSFSATRKDVFDEVLRQLAKRTPPVLETDLQDPSELCDAVIYGCLERIYRANQNTADSENVHAAHAKTYREKYAAELRSLQPTVAKSQRAGSGGAIALHRR